MAKNETNNMTESVNEQSEQVITTENADVSTLKIYREIIKDKFGKVLCDRNGNELHNYYVPCVLNGRDVHIDFSAKDNGGYEMLADIFAIAETAELYIHDETRTDNNGRKSTYRIYDVQNTDTNGILWSYPMKPARKSDESQLAVYLQMRAKGLAA